MRFKRFLNEQYIFLEDKFIKAIEDYVFKNDPKYLKVVLSSKNKIPSMFKQGGIVYRGMFLTDNDLQLIKDNKFKLKNISSWSSDLKIAQRFILDKSKITNAKGNNKILLRKNIDSSNIIIDIYQYILYLNGIGKLDEIGFDELTTEDALEEREKIVDKNLLITKQDIYKIF